jgi:isocitrate dehydrogenase kinase/phosphatase
MTDVSREIASIILAGFDQYRSEFRTITRGAQDRFQTGRWRAAQQASVARIQLYDDFTVGIAESLARGYNASKLDKSAWQAVKQQFISMISGREDAELAETGYNTIFRRLAGRDQLNNDLAFVLAPAETYPGSYGEITRLFDSHTHLRELVRCILSSFHFETPYSDVERDITNITRVMESCIPILRQSQEISCEMLRSVFYRNKGAYLIGRMMIGEHLFPIAIPIQHDVSGKGEKKKLYVDTVIWNENDLSMIFSFTRSYFMVDVENPNDMVKFLHEILPNKKRWELFTSIGFYKHGKTEFYRGFVDHLECSEDQFVIARGIKGLVMTVFTLPSYQVVFKVIRDRFSPTKKVTRNQVKDAYRLVKTHDRVGRMADTQQFMNFIFPKDRFSKELIEELIDVAPSSLTLTDEHVVIRHLYTERAMTPLNIYIEQCSDFELAQALDEYGNAIKQLAAANIFPGDMLLKNFGVTRHGRVVFYDYDEICYLTEVNFRVIPQARYPEDELAAEPWYSVAPNDVFPEEFETFLFNSNRLRSIFSENHADLFDAEYWKSVQRNIRNLIVMDVFPYRRRQQFDRERSSQVQDVAPRLDTD